MSEAPRPGPSRSPADWEHRYVSANTPWETGRVDRNLEAVIAARDIAPCRVLELGCGTGNDALWLAQRGFAVTATDLSSTAIERARQRMTDAGAQVELRVGPIDAIEGRFALAYDCGCFHTQDDDGRVTMAAAIAERLDDSGLWVSIMGSTDGPERDHGPPRLSASQIAASVEACFEVLSLADAWYDAPVPTPARAWVMIARKRG